MKDEEENNMRIIFRPTQMQYDRVQKLMTSGNYKTQSELLRRILNIGLDKLELENEYSPTCAGER